MPDRAFLLEWALAFALTQLVEVPIYVRGFGVRPLAAFGASAITHPLFWFGILPLWSSAWVALDLHALAGDRWASIAFDTGGYTLGETAAVLLEWQYLKKIGVERAFAASCIANGASVAAGLAIQALQHFGP